MTRCAFITVTDYAFWPGTLATVNSIREFHPDVDIIVVDNQKRPLTGEQLRCINAHDNLQVVSSDRFEVDGRYIDAWELKAYAVHDLADDYEVIVGIDSDCLLCSRVQSEIERCFHSGGFIGGKDGEAVDYDEAYEVYGISAHSRNSKYMSTSLYFCAVTEENTRILQQWAECCNQAKFNGRGPYPGHGDQGILNAIIFASGRSSVVELLENYLWSQHWVYWDSIIEFRNGEFLNHSAGGQQQRSLHCGGAEKYWSKAHRDLVLHGRPLQTYPYVWFLAMLWFGRCTRRDVDPYLFLPPANHHLVRDLVMFLPQIMQVYPRARSMWNEISDTLIDRVFEGVPRALSLNGGTMTELIGLVAGDTSIRRFVEVGSYEGGSILTLALRFMNRDIDFFSVESFMGNLDGTMDGHPLPSRMTFLQNLARFPSLRVTLIPGDSGLAATAFDESSIDFVFIDACHRTESVLRDIDVWISKIRMGGIISGDDYSWESVRRAVDNRLSDVMVTGSRNIWYKTV